MPFRFGDILCILAQRRRRVLRDAMRKRHCNSPYNLGSIIQVHMTLMRSIRSNPGAAVAEAFDFARIACSPDLLRVFDLFSRRREGPDTCSCPRLSSTFKGFLIRSLHGTEVFAVRPHIKQSVLSTLVVPVSFVSIFGVMCPAVIWLTFLVDCIALGEPLFRNSL